MNSFKDYGIHWVETDITNVVELRWRHVILWKKDLSIVIPYQRHMWHKASSIFSLDWCRSWASETTRENHRDQYRRVYDVLVNSFKNQGIQPWEQMSPVEQAWCCCCLKRRLSARNDENGNISYKPFLSTLNWPYMRLEIYGSWWLVYLRLKPFMQRVGGRSIEWPCSSHVDGW